MKPMRLTYQSKAALTVLIASSFMAAKSAPVTPVLDGYAYELNSDVVIDTQNNIISIDSNMVNCLQPNNNPPLENTLYALHDVNSPNQFIGLNQITYNTSSGRLFFTSETSNLLCTNGVYVDTIFADDFSGIIFANGFD